MKLPRRQFLHLAASAAALPAVPPIAWAQAYPTRPVRIIVGQAPAAGWTLPRACWDNGCPSVSVSRSWSRTGRGPAEISPPKQSCARPRTGIRSCWSCRRTRRGSRSISVLPWPKARSPRSGSIPANLSHPSKGYFAPTFPSATASSGLSRWSAQRCQLRSNCLRKSVLYRTAEPYILALPLLVAT